MVILVFASVFQKPGNVFPDQRIIYPAQDNKVVYFSGRELTDIR
jgi:hypothetical protein